MERTNDFPRADRFDDGSGWTKGLGRRLGSSEHGRFGKRTAEFQGAAKTHQFLLPLKAARNVAEGSVGWKRLRIERVLGRLRAERRLLILFGLDQGAIFRREDFVALQIFRGVHVPGLSRVSLFAGALLASGPGDILILSLLTLLLLRRGLLFLSL